MIHRLLLTAACAAQCCPVPARADVTLYGIADLGLAADNGKYAAGQVTTLVSGGQAGSRIGVKGTERLGNGFTVLMQLESGYNLDDGALAQGSNLLFGRKALVGLESAWGTVRLGRQDSAVYTSTVNYDPFYEGITGAYTRIMTAISTLRRNDNTIDYTTPAIGHFKAEAAYSPGEVAGDRRAGRGYSSSLAYLDGPLSIGAAVQQANSKPVAPAALGTTRIRTLGASYAFPRVTAYALWSNSTTVASMRTGAIDRLLGLTVPFGAAVVQLSYIAHHDQVTPNADAHQVAVGATYALSKRSSLYARYAYIDNAPNARLGLAASNDGGAPSGTNDQLFSVGLCHYF
jgi:predicted porin